MKGILYVIVLAIMLSACASKKSVERSTVMVDSVVTEKITKASTYTVTDTTRTETGEVIFTEIIFSETPGADTFNISSIMLDKGILSIGKLQGKPIKSIRQSVYGHKKETKGVSQSGTTLESANKVEKKQKREEKKQKQSSSHYTPWWVYVLAVIILAALFRGLYARVTGRGFFPKCLMNILRISS